MSPDGIKFDWISFSLPKNHNESTLPDLIRELFGQDFHDFQVVPKKRNYYRRSFLLSGQNGDKLIEVFTDPDTDHNAETTLVQVSGYALSVYAGNHLQIDVPELFRRILALRGKPTVLHIAMDDTTGRLSWDELAEMSSPARYKEHVVSTSRRVPINLNNETLYFGARRDRNSVCIYRKDVQEGTKFPWLRVEYRTHDRPTAKAIAERVATGAELGTLAAGLVRRFLDFREKSHLTKYNRPQYAAWGDFLGNVDKMIISRDLAPRRNPSKKARKAKSIPTLELDLVAKMECPTGTGIQELLDCFERIGLLSIARFGNTQESQPLIVQEPEQVSEVVPPLAEDFAPDIWFD